MGKEKVGQKDEWQIEERGKWRANQNQFSSSRRKYSQSNFYCTFSIKSSSIYLNENTNFQFQLDGIRFLDFYQKKLSACSRQWIYSRLYILLPSWFAGLYFSCLHVDIWFVAIIIQNLGWFKILENKLLWYIQFIQFTTRYAQVNLP